MNILIFSKHFWPERFIINELAQDLRNEGNHVSVLTGKPNYPAGDIFPGYKASGSQIDSFDGITVHRVPMLPRGKRGLFGLLLNYVSFNVKEGYFLVYLWGLKKSPTVKIKTLEFIICYCYLK